jgi:hypothetical protein
LGDLAIETIIDTGSREAIFKFLDRGLFERIQIGKFQRHSKKLG